MRSSKSILIAIVTAAFCALSAAAQVKEDYGITPVMRAVRDGKSGEVKKLLQQGVDLEAKDDNGQTALFYAVAMGDDRAVRAMLDKGAKVNAVSNDGGTSLMLAALYQDDKIAKMLIDGGADVSAADKNGDTPLSLAARGGRGKTYDLIHKAGGVDPRSGIGGYPIAQDKTIIRPVPLNRPRPNYTDRARAEKVTGAVRVRVLVGVDGQVKMVRVIRGLPAGLTQQALLAVYQMEFKPAMKDGNPVEFWVPVEIEFQLGDRI
jgi:TonB family protein